jgi:putative membrane protein
VDYPPQDFKSCASAISPSGLREYRLRALKCRLGKPNVPATGGKGCPNSRWLGRIVLVLAQTRGIDGFLGTRGSLMLDVVFLAMFAVLPLLSFAIYLAKRKKYTLHKRLQLAIAGVLLVAVAGFEIDMQFLTDWEDRAEASPFFDPAYKWSCPVGIALIIHLCCSVPTFLLWVIVTVQALRKFPSPPVPGPHSRAHLRLSKPAALGMLLTAATGWVFYWMAFAM